MKLHEECGIFGCIVKDNKAFEYIKHGLYMLQHRGQESAGITAGNSTFKTIKNTGLVYEVFKNKKPLNGNYGIGHVRYSTQGLSDRLHSQPFQTTYKGETIAIAHNGNISKLPNPDINTKTLSDTEIILKCLIKDIEKKPSEWTFEDITNSLYKNFQNGAWSILILLPEKLIGVKDPFGYRPLMFAQSNDGYFLASEDCAFSSLKLNKITEINAGEYIEVNKNGYVIKSYYKPKYTKQCVFEHIYFANPVSKIFSMNVYETRIKLGKLMAQEDNTKADIVIPVMNSGLNAAIGYSEQSKIPIHLGLKRNIPIRSFIQPTKEEREKTAKEKYTVIKNIAEGKKIILVDDSIVRGTTMKYLTELLKENGALEVHIRLSSPPIINTCKFGIDIPDTNELIYTKFKNIKEFEEYINADSIKYISYNLFKRVFDTNKFCYNCFCNKIE